MTRVVGHHERDLVRPAGAVGPVDAREVHTGYSRVRNAPGGRHPPIAAVHQARRGVGVGAGVAVGLTLRHRDVGGEAGDLACAIPAVVTHAVDVYRVRRRGRADLEIDRIADIDAEGV